MVASRWLSVGWVGAAVLLATITSCRDFGRFEAEPTTTSGGGPTTGGSGGSEEGGAGGTTSSSMGGAGGGGGGGGPVDVGCGFIDVLADSFDDGDVSGTYWLDGGYDGGLIFEQGGAMQLQLDDGYAGVYRYAAFGLDARGRSLTLELDEAALGADQVFWFDVGPSSDDYVELGLVGDEILIGVEREGLFEEIAARIPFDISAHRFWRFREERGVVHYELSGDGTAFTEVATQAVSEFPTWEYVGVETGAEGEGNGTPGHVRIAALLAEGLSSNCAAASFMDDFDDGETLGMWEYGLEDSNCWIDETNGVTQLGASVTASYDECVRGSTRPFDLRGSSVTLEVVTPDAGIGFFFGVADAADENAITWEIDFSEVHLHHFIDDNVLTLDAFPYEAATMRWIRIREENGVIHWEASADAQSFQEMSSTAVAFDVSTLRLIIGVFAAETPADDTLVEVDNLNVTP